MEKSVILLGSLMVFNFWSAELQIRLVKYSLFPKKMDSSRLQCDIVVGYSSLERGKGGGKRGRGGGGMQ